MVGLKVVVRKTYSTVYFFPSSLDAILLKILSLEGLQGGVQWKRDVNYLFQILMKCNKRLSRIDIIKTNYSFFQEI